MKVKLKDLEFAIATVNKNAGGLTFVEIELERSKLSVSGVDGKCCTHKMTIYDADGSTTQFPLLTTEQRMGGGLKE